MTSLETSLQAVGERAFVMTLIRKIDRRVGVTGVGGACIRWGKVQ